MELLIKVLVVEVDPPQDENRRRGVYGNNNNDGDTVEVVTMHY